jgi:hypothetical protein
VQRFSGVGRVLSTLHLTADYTFSETGSLGLPRIRVLGSCNSGSGSWVVAIGQEEENGQVRCLN